MSILKGPITLQRFRVAIKNDAVAHIRAHALVPIDPAGNETKSVGWASALDPQDTDLDPGKYQFSGRVVLSLRVDTLKPPPAEIKRRVKLRQREIEAELREPLSRSELREIKDLITQDLRRTTPAKTRAVDVIYDPRVSEVWLGTTSKSLTETFCTLWINTFGGSIDLMGPEAEAKASGADLAGIVPERLFLTGCPELRPCPLRDEDTPFIPAQDSAKDLRFLGREFLTWLVFAVPDEPLAAFSIGNRVRLRAISETVADVSMSGPNPGEAPDVRYAIAGGQGVRSLDLIFTWEERVYSCTVDADTLSLSRVVLPTHDYDSPAEAVTFRLDYLNDVAQELRDRFRDFVRLRGGKRWAETVASMRAWMSEAVVR